VSFLGRTKDLVVFSLHEYLGWGELSDFARQQPIIFPDILREDGLKFKDLI